MEKEASCTVTVTEGTARTNGNLRNILSFMENMTWTWTTEM